ncbi:hypothetical protein [Streptomyces sp. NEAU-H3]|uniref:hypothetical protein n=1 Tax=Streptomyces sp. NEAU-H3 TaxID=2720636 RepID=UPI00143BA522|nr:hypothetical protein [Streptomyces sp. NEAU-H3]NJA56693.1 hypothetical protein [Streptomyces sp. NEAU-H3]
MPAEQPHAAPTEPTTTVQQLLTDLSADHMRALCPPTPRHPEARGWRAMASAYNALATRALHALNEVAPDQAAQLAVWFQGAFEEGPDPEEHTDWTAEHIARDEAEVERWVTEGRAASEESARIVAEYTQKKEN